MFERSALLEKVTCALNTPVCITKFSAVTRMRRNGEVCAGKRTRLTAARSIWQTCPCTTPLMHGTPLFVARRQQHLLHTVTNVNTYSMHGASVCKACECGALRFEVRVVPAKWICSSAASVQSTATPLFPFTVE